ncbi:MULTISPECIES: hypothetical protein [unclassified Nocardiopsis]|uniref:hypothetical protein n=1 Tax=unclassified Nocardiopsis TaxID=2649073 RepID=UPI00135C369A|nr:MULTISPECIES: hypothetical protein [unclassified Nocardiopsis]
MPFALAAVLVVALVVSVTGVWQAGEWRLRTADAAHARGECAPDGAAAAYESARSLSRLSLSSSLTERALSGAEACALLESARAGAVAGEYGQALDSYGAYSAHPASRWEGTDGELAALYEAGTGGYADERWCAGFDQIEVFAHADWEAVPEVAERIAAEHPDAAFRCARESLDEGDLGTAEDVIDLLESEYPDHETDEVGRMAARVGAERLGQRMDAIASFGEEELTMPPTRSSGAGGSVLEISNGVPYPMRLFYVGPDAVHGEITAPACEGCGTYDTWEQDVPCSGPVLRAELEPGEYRLLLTWDGDTGHPWHGTADIAVGGLHEACFVYYRE